MNTETYHEVLNDVMEKDTERDKDAGEQLVLIKFHIGFDEAFVYYKHFQHTDTFLGGIL